MKKLLLTSWLWLIATVCIGATLPTFSGRFYGNGGGLTNVPSTNVIYASRAGCVLDSSLAGGGTDDTIALQAALNQALQGPTEVVIDGFALVSGLTLYSNTKLRGSSPRSGLYLKDASNRPLLTNVLSGSSFTASNICIEDLTLHCNGINQTDGYAPGSHGSDLFYWNSGITFTGFKSMLIRRCTVINSRYFSMTFDNADGIVIEDCVTYWTAAQHGGGFPTDGQDGPHFYTVTNVVVRNHRHGGATDGVAFNTDEVQIIADGGPGNPWFKSGGGHTLSCLVDGLRPLTNNITNTITFKLWGNGSSAAYICDMTIRNLSQVMPSEPGVQVRVDNLTIDGVSLYFGRDTSFPGDGDNGGAFDFSNMDGTGWTFSNFKFTYANPVVETAIPLLVIGDNCTNASVVNVCYDSTFAGGNVVKTVPNTLADAASAQNPRVTITGVSARNLSSIVDGGGVGSVALVGATLKGAGAGSSGTFSSVTNIGVLVVP